MKDTTSMSARDSIAGSASLFAELLDNKAEEALPSGDSTLTDLSKIVNKDEVYDQFSQMQRRSTDALEIGREKQLLDYTMLGKMPNELKTQIATVILESHQINAMVMNDSARLRGAGWDSRGPKCDICSERPR